MNFPSSPQRAMHSSSNVRGHLTFSGSPHIHAVALWLQHPGHPSPHKCRWPTLDSPCRCLSSKTHCFCLLAGLQKVHIRRPGGKVPGMKSYFWRWRAEKDPRELRALQSGHGQFMTGNLQDASCDCKMRGIPAHLQTPKNATGWRGRVPG